MCIIRERGKGDDAELLNRIRDLRLKLIRIILGAVCMAHYSSKSTAETYIESICIESGAEH